jgi:hypothetical protein
MIPVIQTKMVVKNSKGEMIVRGNCLAACIASLLEMPISEVPNIETLYGIDDNYYWEVLWRWLGHLGYELSTDDRFRVYHDKEYLKGDYRQIDELRRFLKDKYYLISGKSPRGIQHVCIYQNGKLIHDPHPTKEGILTEEYFESLEFVGAGSNAV